MRNIRRFLPALAALSLCAVALFAGTSDAKKSTRAKVTNFSGTDLSGHRVTLGGLEGKVVVVNFWATWCAPCLQELPFLQRFYDKYKDDGLVVLAVSTDGPETASRVRTVVKQRKFTMPVIHDVSGELLSQLNPRGNNPYTLFIDRHGQKAFAHEGYSSGDEKKYLKVIKALLHEK